MKTRVHLAGAGVLVALIAVACGGDTTVETEATLASNVTSVGFGIICNESAATQTVILEAEGNAQIRGTVSVAGANAAMFTISPTEFTLGGGARQEFTVTYAPSDEKAGGESQLGAAHIANLAIDSNGGPDSVTSIPLSGEVSTQDAKPILSLECAGTPCSQAQPGEACCLTNNPGDEPPHLGRKTLGSIRFGDIELGSTSSVPIKVSNFGCGEATLNGISIGESAVGDFCGTNSVTTDLTGPITLPGTTSRTSPSSQTFNVIFSPTTADVCTLVGPIQVASDDPYFQDPAYLPGNFFGSGARPSIQWDPTFRNFGDLAAGSCAENMFQLRNVGTRPVTLSINLGGDDPDAFEIKAVEQDDGCTANWEVQDPANITLAPSDALNPDCGPDHVRVRVELCIPAEGGSFEADLRANYGSGTTASRMRGGSSPVIVTTPENQVLFQGPTILGCTSCDSLNCEGSCQTNTDCVRWGATQCQGAAPGVPGVCVGEPACAVACSPWENYIQICNRDAGDRTAQAPLEFVDGGFDLEITGGNYPDGTVPYTINPGDCPVNGSLPIGECCTATVNFVSNDAGGVKVANLTIKTNDPAYPAPDYYTVSISGIPRGDVAPTAAFVFRNQNGQDGPYRARQWITLDASTSTDDVPFGGIREYRWNFRGAGGPLTQLPTGQIDLANPNANCPANFPNGQGGCFEVVEPNGRVIRFWPDLGSNGGEVNYSFELQVVENTCNKTSTRIENSVAPAP